MRYTRCRYSSTVQALTMIARTEGARGLFRGVVPTVLTTAPFSGTVLGIINQKTDWTQCTPA